MTVDKNAIDQMARVLAIMNGQTPPPEDNNLPVTTSNAPLLDPMADKAAGIEAMKNILNALNGAVTDSVATNKNVIDRPFNEAILTESIDSGIRVGNWEIRNTDKDRFDVGRVGESESLVKDLGLYEAALGLVRLLNEGYAINSTEVLELLNKERTYSGSLADAIHYARLIKVRNSDPKRMIWEDRFGESKNKAALAKNRLRERVRDLI